MNVLLLSILPLYLAALGYQLRFIKRFAFIDIEEGETVYFIYIYYADWVILIFISILIKKVYYCVDDSASIVKMVLAMYLRYVLILIFHFSVDNSNSGGAFAKYANEFISEINVGINLFLDIKSQFLLTIFSSILGSLLEIKKVNYLHYKIKYKELAKFWKELNNKEKFEIMTNQKPMTFAMLIVNVQKVMFSS